MGEKGKPVLAAEHLHLEVEGQRDEGEQNGTNQLSMQDSLSLAPPPSCVCIRRNALLKIVRLEGQVTDI